MFGKQRMQRILAAVFITAIATLSYSAFPVHAAEKTVDYNRDIRPLLSNTCYKCHGPDANERQTEFRIDKKDGAFAKLDAGGFAIVPGDSANSQLYQRITSKDPEQHMPPLDSGKSLTVEQIELIRNWIDQGATWRGHWSFIAPERSALPAVKDTAFVKSPIDQFILARLEAEGLSPESKANRTTLIRRVTLDLTGLPPTLEQVDRFLADKSADAYEKLVDRLLESPHFGEHMARYWLDAARYGDTHGLHLDNERSLWPYRDWVINSLNKNMPFDQFTVEQLAGDLLPNPSLDQRVATGFNRCNVTTGEGGTIAAEYLVRYAVDRVETTSTVWMGLTAGCAVCHEHKFDPISQKEFYQLFAYFYSLTEKAMDGNALLPPPVLKVPTAEQKRQLAELNKQIEPIQAKINAELARINYKDPQTEVPKESLQPRDYVWFDDDLPKGANPQGNEAAKSWKWVTKPDHPVFSGKRATMRKSKNLTQHFFTGAKPGLRISKGDKLFAYVYIDVLDQPDEIMLQFNDGTWEHRAYWGKNEIQWGNDKTVSRLPMGKLPDVGEWVRLEVDAQAVGLKPGAVLNGWAFTQFDGTVYWDQAGIVSSTPQGIEQYDSQLVWEQVQRQTADKAVPKPIAAAIKLDATKRSKAQQQQIRDYFVERVYSKTRPVFDPLHKQLAAVQQQIGQIERLMPSTMIMQDMPQRRDAFVLIRGQYDKPDKKQQVQPGVPAALPALPKNAPPNRLALANWLVDPSHPLTARVTVNRFWQRYFGTGIVKTSEDFGSQGDWPSHPELLDWLATEFIRSGWDFKHMQKLIVMSATYRQSSRVTRAKYQKDRDNRLLARGPRFRMDAEMLRDSALAVSGLLIPKVGGRSVKPYQPLGLWKAVGYTDSNTANFKQEHGEALYRRSMYTFWKRTSPPPSMATFDAPSRESCSVRRARTNTPLQALVLMNDIQYVEAARNFAQRIMTQGGKTFEDRVEFAFRLATARRPDSREVGVSAKLFNGLFADYQKDKDAALKLVSVGESKRNEALDVGELAAWTIFANLILNLNETITKG